MTSLDSEVLDFKSSFERSTLSTPVGPVDVNLSLVYSLRSVYNVHNKLLCVVKVRKSLGHVLPNVRSSSRLWTSE